MINFASLFGTFNRGGNSAINDLLDRPETSLDQLLDIESFPNEYKSGNNKVLQFMKYPQYQALVKYVTVQGPADNQKKGYKFPMVAAQILSVQSSVALDFFLPDDKIQIEVQYDSQEQYDVLVDDDQQQKESQTPTKNLQTEGQKNQSQNKQKLTTEQQTTKTSQQEKSELVDQQEAKQVAKPKNKKIVKQIRTIKKTKKQQKQPLMTNLLSYYQCPVNYILAGYNCKVLNTLFGKKPEQFFNFIFNSNKNYVELICNHIESKSVGDLITKMLVWENTDFVEQRKQLYDHLIHLMSQLSQAHAISNLAGAIYDIIEKTSTYIKTKINITNNQSIIKVFMDIFYRTDEVHKIVNNAMSENQNRSAYNCQVLHAYLHHTQIQTFNSFKLQEVLQSFIIKASQKLRNIPNRRVLGMGRLKIVQIFSFLIRKQRKTIEDDSKANQLSGQLLQQLYIHSMIASVPDFFSILIKLVETFENNNILHNQVFRIFESVLREPEQNGSALQQLLLNDENVLLKFITSQSEKDKKLKNNQKHTRRKGYIGHVINLCKIIDEIRTNNLLNQKIKQTVEFQQVFNTMITVDIIETNKTLAGYEMKKNPAHEIMFQKQDILNAYASFLSHCPKAQFQPQQKQPSEEEIQSPITEQSPKKENQPQKQKEVEKRLEEEQRDEQKFNEVVANSEIVNQSDPKFWITHIDYDVDLLMKDVQ